MYRPAPPAAVPHSPPPTAVCTHTTSSSDSDPVCWELGSIPTAFERCVDACAYFFRWPFEVDDEQVVPRDAAQDTLLMSPVQRVHALR
mmetsp:Transcript_76764/g.230339  ORF Transcript_76764/g.230339 Transcript_76764/m.230339 type:complete len:88 (+) Transcript_76764:1-264(+)